MIFRSLIVLVLGFASYTATANQPFPTKPVRLVVGYAPGGGADAVARIISPALGEILGGQVVVENRTGAGGTIAAGIVAKSPADGHTLLFADAAFLTAPGMYGGLPYDTENGFAPVAGVVTVPLAIAVGPKVAATTPAELIALIKNNPGKLPYGTPGVGTLHHLLGELMKKSLGLEWTHVAYRGAALLMPDLMGGQLPISIVSATAVLPHAKAGRVRIVAFTTPKRLPDHPETGVMAEVADGLSVTSDLFIVAPRGTPQNVAETINAAIVRVLERPDVREKLALQGAIPDLTTPEQLGLRIRRDIRKWGVIVKDAGISVRE